MSLRQLVMLYLYSGDREIKMIVFNTLPHPYIYPSVFGPTQSMALPTLRVEWEFLCSISGIILIDIFEVCFHCDFKFNPTVHDDELELISLHMVLMVFPLSLLFPFTPFTCWSSPLIPYVNLSWHFRFHPCW